MADRVQLLAESLLTVDERRLRPFVRQSFDRCLRRLAPRGRQALAGLVGGVEPVEDGQPEDGEGQAVGGAADAVDGVAEQGDDPRARAGRSRPIGGRSRGARPWSRRPAAPRRRRAARWRRQASGTRASAGAAGWTRAMSPTCGKSDSTPAVKPTADGAGQVEQRRRRRRRARPTTSASPTVSTIAGRGLVAPPGPTMSAMRAPADLVGLLLQRRRAPSGGRRSSGRP